MPPPTLWRYRRSTDMPLPSWLRRGPRSRATCGQRPGTLFTLGASSATPTGTTSPLHSYSAIPGWSRMKSSPGTRPAKRGDGFACAFRPRSPPIVLSKCSTSTRWACNAEWTTSQRFSAARWWATTAASTDPSTDSRLPPVDGSFDATPTTPSTSTCRPSRSTSATSSRVTPMNRPGHDHSQHRRQSPVAATHRAPAPPLRRGQGTLRNYGTRGRPGPIRQMANWQATLELAEINAPHGFMRYYRSDVTAAMAGSASFWKATEYLMGNHTIAERMFHHEPAAMLHAPL